PGWVGWEMLRCTGRGSTRNWFVAPLWEALLPELPPLPIPEGLYAPRRPPATPATLRGVRRPLRPPARRRLPARARPRLPARPAAGQRRQQDRRGHRPEGLRRALPGPHDAGLPQPVPVGGRPPAPGTAP